MRLSEYVSKELRPTPMTLTPKLAQEFQKKFDEDFSKVVTWHKALKLNLKSKNNETKT